MPLSVPHLICMAAHDRPKCPHAGREAAYQHGVNMSDLRDKYGPRSFEAGRAIQPDTFEQRVEQRDSLDQHFTKLWLDFAVNGISRRPALDLRTRLLVLIGQYTMAKSHPALADTIKAALN